VGGSSAIGRDHPRTGTTASAVAVAVFTRAPVPGTVKTRLIPALGADGACRLHERMSEHAAAVATAAGVGPVTLWCAPHPRDPFLRALARRHSAGLACQAPGDLGRRMETALTAGIGACGAALVIGSDCPDLLPTDLRSAAAALHSGVDAVLGPAADGGYVLIGLRRLAPSLFEGPLWGTDSVLEDTRARLRALRWRWHELAVRHDIDRPEDLARLDPGWLATPTGTKLE
jgi:uncharacterized protein